MIMVTCGSDASPEWMREWQLIANTKRIIIYFVDSSKCNYMVSGSAGLRDGLRILTSGPTSASEYTWLKVVPADPVAALPLPAPPQLPSQPQPQPQPKLAAMDLQEDHLPVQVCLWLFAFGVGFLSLFAYGVCLWRWFLSLFAYGVCLWRDSWLLPFVVCLYLSSALLSCIGVCLCRLLLLFPSRCFRAFRPACDATRAVLACSRRAMDAFVARNWLVAVANGLDATFRNTFEILTFETLTLTLKSHCFSSSSSVSSKSES